MMYQIALKIDSAKRFINKERLGKIVLEHTMYEFGDQVRDATVADRTDCPDGTLPLHCVANAIAVLSGSRPIPAKRKHSPLADYPEFAKYEDIARRARIRIDTIPDNHSIMQTAKSSMYNLTTGDASVKQQKTAAVLVIDGEEKKLNRACPTHESVGVVWPRETYLRFDALCQEILGKDYKSEINVLQTISKLRDLYVAGNRTVKAFFEELTSEKKLATVLKVDLVEPVVNGVVGGSIFRGETWARAAELKSWGAAVAVYGTPEPAWVVNGYIYLKLTEDEVDAILNGPEIATILDGGTLTPVGPNGTMDFVSLRDTVCAWDEYNETYPTPFEPSAAI